MAEILIIDDDPGTFELFAKILSLAGHRVTCASSGRQAIELMRHQNLDVALVDLRLPDIPGLDLLEYIQVNHPGIQCIMATAFATTQEVVRATKLGAIDFLEKPVDEQTLLSTLGNTTPQISQVKLVNNRPDAPAAARLAGVIVRVIESRQDPKTLNAWAQLVFVSRGTLRNWSRTLRISPRRALIFARLLRAVILSSGGRHTLENVLDVVDQRTIANLLKFAGLEKGDADLYAGVQHFIERQTLIIDQDVLLEIKRAVACRLEPRSDTG